MDDQTFSRLVQSVSQELEREGRGQSWSGDGSGGFYLVDSWRIRSTEREEFLEFYTTYVTDVIKKIDGFREVRVLVAPIESSYSWHVQAFYGFQSDDILERFRKDFDRAARQARTGKNLQQVLEHIEDWVLAHEDGTMIEVSR